MAHVLRAQITVAVTSSGVEIPINRYASGNAELALTFNQRSGFSMFYVKPGATAAETGTAIASGDGNAPPLEGIRVRDGNPKLWVNDAGPHNCKVDIYEVV